VLTLAPQHFPAHQERLREFHARGELLMVGTFADPVADGSMAIFATREGAEEFVKEDPFVLQGVVSSWTLREWNEILAP
jgi:uncharacterized protein YciI